jgi:hypothetical protein
LLSAQLDAGRGVVGAPLLPQPGRRLHLRVRSASTTTITGIVNAGDFATDSLTGVPYDVFVSVVDPDNSDGLTTPTGSVHFRRQQRRRDAPLKTPLVPPSVCRLPRTSSAR